MSPTPSKPGALARLSGAGAVASLLACVDVLAVRSEYHHRPTEFALFAEALGLWFAYALLGLPFSVAWDALLRRRTADERFGHPARAAARHAVWVALPVLAHSRLDAFTGIGGDVSALRSAGPWLEVAACAAGLVLAAAFAGRALQRVRARTAALGVLVVSASVGSSVSFHSGGAQTGPAAAPGAPNVLLLVWDTTRAESLSFYGYDRETTPHLAELAEQSLRFTNSRSVSTYTLTSHLSMLTGVYPSHHGARLTRQRFHPLDTPTVVKRFRDAGYRTGAFVGTDVLRAQSGISFAFESYDDRVDPWVTYTHAWALLHDAQSLCATLFPGLRANGLPHWIQDFQRPASEVLGNALAWIEDGDPRPWFCFVNLYDAHWPYLPEADARDQWVRPYDGIVDGYSKRGDRVHASKYVLDARDHAHLVDLYDGELWSLDREVDRFLARLDFARTGIVMTSDHGEAFGEGGRYEHGDILECQTRVPLLVKPAGASEGQTLDAPVNGVDVAPTLLALGGLGDPRPPVLNEAGVAASGMLGRSLLGVLDMNHPLLVENRDHPDPAVVKLALHDWRWKLVREGLGEAVRWRLYDVTTDTLEARDVAAEHPEVLERLREQLTRLRATWGADDERDSRRGEVGNTDALDALGYGGGH